MILPNKLDTSNYNFSKLDMSVLASPPVKEGTTSQKMLDKSSNSANQSPRLRVPKLNGSNFNQNSAVPDSVSSRKSTTNSSAKAVSSF